MLALRCTLLRDVFEGGEPDDPRRAEWPPSWMRLFSALVSVAEPASDDDTVLRVLEQAGPPAIRATPALRVRRDAFVPTNRVLSETRHTNLPGRTNGERVWARAIPRSPEIWYRWDSLTLDSGEMSRLASLCRRVPYFGRSTSPALVEVVHEGVPDDGWLEPVVDAAAGARLDLSATVRNPFPGALDALRAAYEERFKLGEAGDPWEIGQGVDYGAAVPAPPAPVSGPYSTMVVLRLVGPSGAPRSARRRLDGRHAARVTHAVRRALLSRSNGGVAALHGHHDGDVVQVAFLGLLDVGHNNADGHLLGVALALPDLPADDLEVIAAALPGLDESQPLEVAAGPLGRLFFMRTSPLDASTVQGLRPERWTAPSRRWASVTPVVLDRYPGVKGDLHAEIRRAAVNARLPEPHVVLSSRDPVVLGGPRFAPADTLRRPRDRVVPYRHVVLDFPELLRGPVVLGAMRHYGLGLCMPVHGAEADDGQA